MNMDIDKAGYNEKTVKVEAFSSFVRFSDGTDLFFIN